MLRNFLYISIFTIITCFQIEARSVLQFTGGDIPNQIKLESQFIAENSDTLIFNNQQLQRGIDYQINKKFKRIELLFEHNNDEDTLLVFYRILPTWLQQKYGREFPQFSTESKTSTIEFPSEQKQNFKSNSDVTIQGSKSFRFSTSKSGSSGFNQTLDLKLSGYLAKNLSLQGTISDRGYNPSYGTSNSRLNELDKINLKIESPNFMTQIGDIVVRDSYTNRNRDKKISGINLNVHNKNMSIGIIAARPKGQFVSYEFVGQQNKQGPYQVLSQGVRQAIIPGSETVWLDGIELERGANKDYLIDYPNGQITFNVNRIIDSRSRVLIDFEPLSSEYKQEYLHGSTNLFSTDSTYRFKFNLIREGDDKNENQSQQFSKEDEELLANISGDNQVFKSGILSDTIGDYELLIDTLGDSLFQYVGDSLGQYEVKFTFVEQGIGDYVYQGSNIYSYIGKGEGDYLPLIVLHAPQRTDFLESSFVFSDKKFGIIQTDWSQSRRNNNLFVLNENIIEKNYYQFKYSNVLQDSVNSIQVFYRKKEFGFIERDRINDADFWYQYYLPQNAQFDQDEEHVLVQSTIQLHKSLSITPKYSQLIYQNQFKSEDKSLGLKFKPVSKITLSGSLQNINADLQDSSKTHNGESDNNEFELQYKLSKEYTFKSLYRKTKRTNDYIDEKHGFSFDSYSFSLSNANSEINYTRYNEDTLSTIWELKKKRDRIGFKTTNSISNLDYIIQASYQQTDNISNKKSSLLSRASFNYRDRKRNLNIQSSYMLSNETRFSKGIRYLEVNDGEGDYIFSDSQYIPEAGGNFILVEELLSQSAPVKRGEKSFSISKRWEEVNVSLNSILNEELLATEKRSKNWILPFYSNANLSYLFFSRYSKSSVKAFPLSGGYALTLNLSEKKEIRLINQIARLNESKNAEMILNQKSQDYYFEEKVEYFQDKRDAYYYRDGDVDGITLSGKIKKVSKSQTTSVQARFRSAESSISEKSKIYMILVEEKINIQKKGEIKIESEFYRSDNNTSTSTNSYLLTNNRPGTKGAIWSVIFRAKLKKDFRLNLSVQGRHSDSNKARIFARTEFVAEF